MKNTICKKCGKKFHACSSCYLTSNWEYIYCSEDCWKSSDEFKKMEETFTKYYTMLVKKMFNELIDFFSDYDYEFIIENWLKDMEKIEKEVEKGKWELET